MTSSTLRRSRWGRWSRPRRRRSGTRSRAAKASREELLALGKQVFDEVKAAISPRAQKVITDNLGSFDKYLTAVIEDAVLKVKQEDPYLTLSGELIKDAAPEDKAGAAAQ